MHRRAAQAGGKTSRSRTRSAPRRSTSGSRPRPAPRSTAPPRASADDVAVALRHRVQAADRHDDELAAALVELADRDAARGAWGTAAESFAAAGRLSADSAAAASRLLQAIDLRLLSRRPRRRPRAGDELPPGESVLRDAVLGHLSLYEQRPVEAHALLERAWAAVEAKPTRAMAARVSRSMVHVQIADLRMDDVLVWSDRTLERTAPGEPDLRVRARQPVRSRSATAASSRGGRRSSTTG